jgi:hypothetical protein
MTKFHMLFLLLVVFQVKHLVADYPLQTKYMLGKFKDGWDFFFPLWSHCLVHAYITFFIVMYFTDISVAVKCFYIDFIIHFIMDRIKAGPKYLGRFKDMTDRKFWWCLGLDQMVHHMTHYLIIYFILREMK